MFCTSDFTILHLTPNHRIIQMTEEHPKMLRHRTNGRLFPWTPELASHPEMEDPDKPKPTTEDAHGSGHPVLVHPFWTNANSDKYLRKLGDTRLLPYSDMLRSRGDMEIVIVPKPGVEIPEGVTLPTPLKQVIIPDPVPSVERKTPEMIQFLQEIEAVSGLPTLDQAVADQMQGMGGEEIVRSATQTGLPMDESDHTQGFGTLNLVQESNAAPQPVFVEQQSDSLIPNEPTAEEMANMAMAKMETVLAGKLADQGLVQLPADQNSRLCIMQSMTDEQLASYVKIKHGKDVSELYPDGVTREQVIADIDAMETTELVGAANAETIDLRKGKGGKKKGDLN
jgi:hypothetical protein